MRRPAAALALVVTLFAMSMPAVAVAATPRASLTDIEQDVMCVVCKEPLAVAQSPQADRERAFISTLIRQGLTKAQIERQLVVNYGQSVLALPPAHGFNLTVYVLPPAVLLIGAGLLAYALPRWRRRARATSLQTPQTGPPLGPAESQRLDEELARFGR
jgi:cytochrome c-type biogenesis protein CcmH/NrfF